MNIIILVFARITLCLSPSVRVSSLEAGRSADIVIFAADPLASVTGPETVIIGGVLIEP
jgi:imidazolonepropionase-like amidohydrolase